MAESGVAARRACETMIEEGRVRVNGAVVRKLPVFVNPWEDRIDVDGRPLPRRERARPRHIYLMLNKPAKTLSVAQDEPGADRRTVLNLVDHPSKPRLFPVGRLEYDATGLVLLTNDGEMANRLTHPRYGVAKTYEAVVKGAITDRDLGEIQKTLQRLGKKAAREKGGAKPGGVEFRPIKRDAGKTLLEITLREGRNREIADALELAGFPIKRLTQVRLGPLELKGVAVGSWRELTRDEMLALRGLMRGKTGAKIDPKSRRGGPGPKSRVARADESMENEAREERPARPEPAARVAPAAPPARRQRTPAPAPRSGFKPRTLTPDDAEEF